MGEVLTAFSNQSSQQFLTKFGIKKPDFDTEIIFTCRIGQRSQSAANAVKNLGYTK